MNTDNTNRDAEPSPASAGSQRDTPLFSERRKMADAAFEWCRKNNASDRAIENIVAALFSLGLVVKRPTLTDAEREAIWFFAAIDSNYSTLGKHAATLRNLLERLT